MLLAGLFFGINKLFANPLGQCPQVDSEVPVLLAHTSDATKFYECSNGVPILKECHPGLHFNPWTYVCDRPENVDSGSGKGIPYITRVWCWQGNIGMELYKVDCEGTEGWCVPKNPC